MDYQITIRRKSEKINSNTNNKITEILNSPYFKRLTWINRLKILIIKLIT